MHPKPLTITGRTYATFDNIQDKYTAVGEEDTEVTDVVQATRAMTTWRLGAVLSQSQKRTFAAKKIQDVLSSATSEDLTLSLKKMGLPNIPEMPFKCAVLVANLRHLNLSENSLTEFPMAVVCLTGLETLSLSDNKLREIPEEIGNLTYLQTLSVSRNHLTALPRAIGKLQKLTILYATENNIKMLPAEIGQLHAAQITLYENHLETLPKEIGDIKELKDLDVSSNHLRAIPTEIGNLIQLCNLSIYGNKDLADLPNALMNCTHITSLDVEGTKITKERQWHFLNTWNV